MKKIFFSLPIAEALSRVEAGERSARRWSMSALAVAILLWVWARAPSFDLFPALASIFFRIAAFLSYGLLPPVGSFVSGASQYFSLGYAIIFGPAILLFLVWIWLHREVHALKLQCWIAQHPSLPRPDSKRLLFRQLGDERMRRIPGAALKGMVLIGASVTLLVRYTDFRSSPELGGMTPTEYCKTVDQGCKCNEVWIDPWRGAEERTSWWWPPATWCVSTGSGQLRNFKSVLPASFLEQQQKRKADDPSINGQAEKLAALLGISVQGASSQFDLIAPRRPYDTFPYVYPAATMWINTIVTVIILGLWLRLSGAFLPACVGREHWTARLWLRVMWRRRRRRQGENLEADSSGNEARPRSTRDDAER